jgi:hypothetical protein
MKWVYILQVLSILLSGTGIYLIIIESLNLPPGLIASGAILFGLSEKLHKKVRQRRCQHNGNDNKCP